MCIRDSLLCINALEELDCYDKVCEYTLPRRYPRPAADVIAPVSYTHLHARGKPERCRFGGELVAHADAERMCERIIVQRIFQPLQRNTRRLRLLPDNWPEQLR